ncbi:SDR family oxidoreductase [Thiomonas sp.]
MRLPGKKIVVTGAASGIGAETVKELKGEGATVVGVDRNPADGADHFVRADLSDPASIAHAAAAVGGGIDALCNIAGLPPTRSAAAVLRVNFPGLRAFTEVEKYCEAHRVDDARSYFLSKETLIVWTMLNRWTWRDRGIRMNCVSPGPVQTPILADCIQTLGARAEEDMKVMDRPGTPEDIAPLVAFLCSSPSAWIRGTNRGTNIPCDGGMYAHVLTHMHGFEWLVAEPLALNRAWSFGSLCGRVGPRWPTLRDSCSARCSNIVVGR